MLCSLYRNNQHSYDDETETTISGSKSYLSTYILGSKRVPVAKGGLQWSLMAQRGPWWPSVILVSQEWLLWSRVAHGSEEWSLVAQLGSWWLRVNPVVRSGPWWFRVVSCGPERFLVLDNGPWWWSMVPGGSKWFQALERFLVLDNGPWWWSMVPGGSKWSLVVKRFLWSREVSGVE